MPARCGSAPAASLSTGGAFIVNGGTFDVENGSDQSVGSLSGTAGGTVTLGNGTTLHVDQSTTTTFAGRIGGTGDLFKSGTGTLILTGTNDYTGDTLVSDGRLELGPGGSLAPSTSLSVTGGVFDLENGGQTVGGLSAAPAAPSIWAMATSLWTRPRTASTPAASAAPAA